MSLQHAEDEDKTIYKVVVNHEEQYSIWPEYKANPLGWNDVGKTGLKAECLAYIKEVWTDMRPLSLRKKMEEMANNPPPPAPVDTTPKGPSLVDRLSVGDHKIVVSQRPEPTVKALKEAIDNGYVRVKFTETKGGTELGFKVDPEASDLSKANFDEGTGKVRLAGGLTLDYVKVRCIADIDLKTLDGVGHLEKVSEAGA
ncbi:MAG TPA: MbtH family NRPS accessory protein [Pyrinomonadaceae bacterium]|nr:MbtH family NRPS accessory protein [Pyrinomonadaceae bacterium]